MTAAQLPWERVDRLLSLRPDDTFGLIRGRVDSLHAVLRMLSYQPAGPIDASVQSDAEILRRVQALKETATRHGDAVTACQCEEVLERHVQPPDDGPQRWLLIIEDDVDPTLDGPFVSDDERLAAAREHRAEHGEEDRLFGLDMGDVATFTAREIEQPIELLHLQRTGRYRPILCGAAGGIVVDDPEQATCPDCLHARRKTDVHLAITYGPTAGSTWCYGDGGPQTDDPAAATCTDCLDRYREHAS